MANPAGASSMMTVSNTVVQQQRQTLASTTSNQTQARPPASMPNNLGSQSIHNGGGNKNYPLQECAPRDAQKCRDAPNLNVRPPGVGRQSNPLPQYTDHAAMTVRSNDSMGHSSGTLSEKTKQPKKGGLVSHTTLPRFCSGRLTVPA